ncbi:MAG: hypothetical protein IPN96_02240 [Anaerolineales bacterium]|nr:hypothetical protein [Anaerolineales bacterium]
MAENQNDLRSTTIALRPYTNAKTTEAQTPADRCANSVKANAPNQMQTSSTSWKACGAV